MQGKKYFTLPNLLAFVACLGLEIGAFYLSRYVSFPILFHLGVFLLASATGMLPALVAIAIAAAVAYPVDHSSFYYMIVGLWIVIIGGVLEQFPKLKGPLKAVIFAVVSILGVASIDAGLHYFILRGGTYSSFQPKWFVELWDLDGKVHPYFAFFLPALLFAAIDLSLTTVVSLIVRVFTPRSVLALFYAVPLEKKAQQQKEDRRVRFSIRSKIGAFNAIVTLAIGVTVVGLTTSSYQREGIDSYSRLTQAYVLGANQLLEKGDAEIMVSSPTSERYGTIKGRLDSFYENAGVEVAYIYAYQMIRDESGAPFCKTIYDCEPEVAYGEVIPFDAYFLSFEQQLFDPADTQEIGPVIGSDEYGWLMTYYHPLLDSTGKKVAYICVDVDMTDVMANINAFAGQLSSLFAFVLIAMFVVTTALISRFIVNPIKTLESRTSDFKATSPLEWEQSPAKAVQKAILSHDEIGNLYEAIVASEDSICSSFREIQDQQEKMLLMERNIIYTMSVMVEARDKNTGDHIRKTQFYASLIVNGCLARGLFPDTVTSEYARNLVLAAPLHDVGKIMISDVILNKPGKLTDEEFLLMRQHVAEGAKIIDMALQGVSGTTYLSIARDVALYHHEKYDGSGYLAGLKGEEIPLSARIMAIADVFDALVSKRSYKDPFPYEKAIGIMKEGRGTHFDPTLIDLFLSENIQIRVKEELGVQG